MNRNFFTTIRAGAADPRRPLLSTRDGRTYSYADAFDAAGRFAAFFAELGMSKGDRLVAQVDKSPEALFLYLACLRAGVVFVPLNTGYTLGEVEYFLTDAQPSLVVCRPESAAAITELATRLGISAVETLGAARDGSLIERSDAGPILSEDAWIDDADLAALLYTSGTTGRSKGAMLTHENLRSNALALCRAWHFEPSDVLVHALPIFHTHGLFVACNVTMLAGSSMIFLPKFNAEEILELLPVSTVMMGVPTFYTRLLQEPGLTRDACARMRLFVSGSAPLLAETHREWRARTGHAILERYGMTETNMNASNPYRGDRVPGSVGPAIEGVEIRIVDENTAVPVAEGDIGMIEIRGPNVFKGYWRMPEKTASEFRPDGFFITGDLGRIDQQGYLTIVGRSKDLIITGGYNVYPKEVEIEIDALESVLESAVVGIPDADFGEAVTAFVVLKPEKSLTQQEVLVSLRARLASYKLPKSIVFRRAPATERDGQGSEEPASRHGRWAGMSDCPDRAASG